jgi:hypothetical protein
MRYAVRLLRFAFMPVVACSIVTTFAANHAASSPSTQSADLRVNVSARPHTSKSELEAATLEPGDSVDRVLDLQGPSKGNASVTMTVAPVDGRSSLLDTDRTSGLQLSITECTGKKARFVLNGATAKCVRGHTKSIARLPVADAEARTVALRRIVLGPAMHLRLGLVFPHSAGNQFQDAGSILDFRFTVRAKPPRH